ncbi:MAG: UDP-N-acetylglucosamine 2-epimerase (non-hydrolyzing) [Armatimonadetes bacterium]|nr:UDP-N-acetylglucosamine 2-epimerase (non-hydrolyzing) [Armatimonadota bacterium]
MKVMTVFGTRPDAIKMSPVVLELQRFPEKVKVVIAVTGQHREMLHQVLDVFHIKPQYNLDIMRPKQSLAEITTRSLEGLEGIVIRERPDIVLAQGDTTTTFVASLAAFYNKVAVGHVEAGLRTDNKYDPFPEEMNRRLTTVLADLHFAPTPAAKKNLLAEGIPASRIYVTGNTVIDALLSVAETASDIPAIPGLAKVNLDGRRMILVTAHRRENWGEPMRRICVAIRSIVEAFPDTEVVFAVHKNPIVRDIVFKELGGAERVHLIEPPDYVPFVHLLKKAHLILTDSGGVQEEAPALGKPVLVMRKTTERPEGVEAGTAALTGTESDDVFQAAAKLLTDQNAYNNMARAINPYGDGSASVRIREALFKYFGVD